MNRPKLFDKQIVTHADSSTSSSSSSSSSSENLFRYLNLQNFSETFSRYLLFQFSASTQYICLHALAFHLHKSHQTLIVEGTNGAIKMAKSNGKEPTTLIFNDFTLGLGEAELCFRLVHLWEAQNTSRGGMLISVELLMTNEHVWNHCPLPIMFRLSFQIQWLTYFIYQRVLLYHLFDGHSLSISFTHNSASRQPGGDWLR